MDIYKLLSSSTVLREYIPTHCSTCAYFCELITSDNRYVYIKFENNMLFVGIGDNKDIFWENLKNNICEILYHDVVDISNINLFKILLFFKKF
jgi:hypothetical protein